MSLPPHVTALADEGEASPPFDALRWLRGETSPLELSDWPLHPWVFTVPCDANTRAFMGGNLLRAAILQSLSFHGTTTPKSVCVHWHVPLMYPVAAFDEDTLPEPQGPGGLLLADLRRSSQLTYEELAPMLGVSRRTLHNWNSGSPISARREARLRRMAEAVRTVASVSRRPIRNQLLDAQPGGLRVYDLLAEGLFQEAVDVAAGRRPHEPAPERAERDSVATQLDRRDDAVELTPGRLRSDMSRRVR